MKYRELDELINRHLSDVLTGHGFRYRRADEGFVRRIDAGLQRITVGIADYEPMFDFSPTFAIRLDAVEAIFNLVNEAEARYHGLTTTILVQSDVLIGKDEWRAETDDELSTAVKDMTRTIRDQGIPFLDRHTDIRALDLAMNSTRIPPLDSSVSPSREMHSLILAHVANNPDFDSLVRRYLSALPVDHVGRGPLVQLVDYLRSIRTAGS
jgi:hypothetical protein